MAVTAKAYGPFLQSLVNKEIDLDSDTLKCMLTTSSYTPNQDTHRYKSDVTNEITGTGYTAGGVTLANVAVSYTAGTNVLKLTSDDPSWASSTLTARYAVFYDSTPGSDATRPLISYVDFGENFSSTNGTFLIDIDAAGILTMTAA